MSSRHLPRRSLRLKYTKFAWIKSLDVSGMGLTRCWIVGGEMDRVLVDRRRLARAIRREFESISREIEALEKVS